MFCIARFRFIVTSGFDIVIDRPIYETGSGWKALSESCFLVVL